MKHEKIKRTEKKSNFTVIDNHYVDDIRLSDTSTRIITILLTKPNDWGINQTYFINQYNIGKFKVAQAFKQLIELGYLVDETPERKNNPSYVLYERTYRLNDIPYPKPKKRFKRMKDSSDVHSVGIRPEEVLNGTFSSSS
jgi:hypothetical protein